MFQLTYATGDLSNPPPDTLVVHACNCQGSLGAGVALAMKRAFPAAHQVYTQKCKDASYGEQLRGECFLIPPQDNATDSEEDKKCWIACLLTSHGYGSKAVKSGRNPHPKKDGKDMIVASTRKALESLREQMQEVLAGEEYPEVYSNRMNSGYFGVPWDETEATIKEVFEGMDVKWTVVDLEK